MTERFAFDIAIENRGTYLRIMACVISVQMKGRIYRCKQALPEEFPMHSFRLITQAEDRLAMNSSLMTSPLVTWDNEGTLDQMEEGVRALTKIFSRMDILAQIKGEPVTIGELMMNFAEALELKWILLRDRIGYIEYIDDPLIPIENGLAEFDEALKVASEAFRR